MKAIEIQKKQIETGSKIKIKTKEKEFTGTLLPSKEFIEIKLENGYNVGLSPEKIEKIEIMQKPPKPVEKTMQEKQNENLPLITIIHTGGTIASKVDYNKGGVIASFKADEMLEMFPELKKIARIKSVFLGNLMSEDMRFSDYAKIANAIKAEAKNSNGIIITHGTDTMHYTSAALSFMLEGLSIPVILTGSQRSSDRPSSDAALNLLSSAVFAAKTDFSGIAICMHSTLSGNNCLILPALKTKKLHSTRRDAFKAVNANPIAEINPKNQKITYYSKNYSKRKKQELKIFPKFEEKIGILKAKPNLLPEEIAFFEKNNYKGLIIEGTGLGHAPINTEENKENKKALQSLIKKGCIVCITTQCIFGRVHENVYSNARALKELGVIFLEDMLSETAFIKLAWLSGNFETKKAIELMPKNLKGEISQKRGTDFL